MVELPVAPPTVPVAPEFCWGSIINESKLIIPDIFDAEFGPGLFAWAPPAAPDDLEVGIGPAPNFFKLKYHKVQTVTYNEKQIRFFKQYAEGAAKICSLNYICPIFNLSLCFLFFALAKKLLIKYLLMNLGMYTDILLHSLSFYLVPYLLTS